MSDCSRHSKQVNGIADMNQLAIAIGDLHYESFAEFLDKLTDKLFLDAAKDRAEGRKDLANALEYVANHIFYAHIGAEEVWKISKPFMKQ